MAKTRHYQVPIVGMQCVDCENNIESAVTVLPGVLGARANFTDESLSLDIDTEIISLNAVCAAIQDIGYDCGREGSRKSSGLIKRVVMTVLALSGIALLLQLSRLISIDVSLDDVNEHSGLGVIFLVGVLSSFHCIGMCGGFVLSYTAGGAKPGRSSYPNHLIYGVGKTISYATMGAFFGFIGGVVNFTIGMQSMAMALAAGFLIIYGLSLLEAFSGLRRFHIRLPRFLIRRMNERRRQTSNPLVIGLLNGLMIACGPLQAMYVMAAGIGSPMYGAVLLSVFSLGTLPVMFAFGFLSSLMTANVTRNLLKVSGVIIILVGGVMLNRSMRLSGAGFDVHSLSARISEWSGHLLAGFGGKETGTPFHIQEGYQVIYTEALSNQYIPSRYALKLNVPVKWIINVKELSPCNQRISFPDLNMTIDLKEGLQMVEFRPQKTGVMGWGCSMGMIPGAFVVQD
ncbi:MAG: urease accessory protein UreH domain-containing protein [Gammaproteobacteria bacterium]